MSRVFRPFFALLSVSIAASLYGCGSSGPSTPVSSTSAGGGRMAISIQFPSSRSRQTTTTTGALGVPTGTAAVRIALLDPTSGASLAQPQIVAPPAAGASSTAQFDGVRVGAVQVIATAHPDAQATQTPIAFGSATT